MPLNNSGSPSQPILHRVGLVGAAARFYQRSYAADYIALGFLAIGWLVVSRIFAPSLVDLLANSYLPGVDPSLREPIPSHVLP